MSDSTLNDDYMPDSHYYDKKLDVQVTHGDLPHWHQSYKYVFVTFRLAGSLPAQVVKETLSHFDEWVASHPHYSKDECKEQFMLRAYQRWEAYLDEGHERTYLKYPECRDIIKLALHHFDGNRYQLEAYVIMPNHVHVILRLGEEWTLASILHSIKSYTSKGINKLLKSSGSLWERESFDRIIRSHQHLEYVKYYIKENPRHCSPGTYSYWQRQD